MQFAFTVTGLIVRFNTSSLYLGYCCYAVIFSWGVVTHFILPSNCSCCWTLLQLRSSLAKLPQYCFFFPVHLFLCVGCIAVLSSISMPSRRPKKLGHPRPHRLLSQPDLLCLFAVCVVEVQRAVMTVMCVQVLLEVTQLHF